MSNLAKLLTFVLISQLSLPALAGSRSGPQIIWVNLSENRHVEALINKKLAAQDDCLAPSAAFTPLPDSIPIELVKKAVFNKDKKAISELDKLMRKRFDDYLYDGFDGIMIYDEKSGPRLSNLVRDWKHIINRKFPDQASESSQWEEFCKLVPEIRRQN